MDKYNYYPLGEVNFFTDKYESEDIFGPTFQKSFILYYVMNGKGKYTLGKTYQLDKGHIFIVFPNSLVLQHNL